MARTLVGLCTHLLHALHVPPHIPTQRKAKEKAGVPLPKPLPSMCTRARALHLLTHKQARIAPMCPRSCVAQRHGGGGHAPAQAAAQHA